MGYPTSALTFEDLIKEVARKVGVGYYGANGDEALQVPINVYDLDECKRHVNNALRMFIDDGPEPNGWRFLRPVAQVIVWGTIGVDSTNKATSGGYNATTNRTTINVTDDSFYATMEGKTITFTTTGDFVVASYVTAKQITVIGDATAIGTAGETWSMTADGNYTLPADFGGQFLGDITYTADTNQGIGLEWRDEGHIRAWRETVTDDSGDPYWAAVRPMSTVFDERRRWELMVYPTADEVLTIEFPYLLHFDKLVELNEHPPVPIGHDEALKAACLMTVEKDVEEIGGGPATQYYMSRLRTSHRVDAASAPKRLGYFGNPSRASASSPAYFRNHLYDRPNVATNF